MKNLVWHHIDGSKISFESVPTTTGVYIYLKGKTPIYIGKSVSLKARITSHYQSAKLDRKERAIQDESDSIKYTLTDNEFKALLLESELIRRHQPLYNRIWKDDKSYLYIRITGENLPHIYPVRKTDIKSFTPKDKRKKDKAIYFGPFPSARVVENILKSIRRVVPFCMRQNLGKRRCFYSKIGLCNPCPSYIQNIESDELRNKLDKQYKKQIKLVKKALEGDISEIEKYFYKEIKLLADVNKFEEALKLRNKITRFQKYIALHTYGNDSQINYNQSEEAIESLLKTLQNYYPKIESLNRIECYDASTLSGKDSTASMVVLTDGLIDKSQYRKFKIKNPRVRSDFGMLKEAITRRFKNKWPIPDLIVLDGGKPQVRKILKIIDQLEVPIPLIGIAKHPDRLIIGVGKLPTLKLKSNDKGLRLIQLIRDESHRFANKYQKQIRL